MCGGSMFQLKQFFCCASLKTGSFIIGYLGLLGNVLQIAGGSAQFQYMQTLFFKIESCTNSNTNGTTESVAITHFALFYTQYMAIAIAYHVVSFFFHCALIWGLHKSKTEFILPWLIIKAVECVVVVIIAVVATIAYIATPGMNVGIMFLLIAIFILCTWLVTYTYMCVYSYYDTLKSKFIPENEEKDLPPIYIKSFQDEKNIHMSNVTINQGV